MKQATCKQLRGVCDVKITGSTPKQMGENARDHVKDMLADGDKAHEEVVKKMMSLSKAQQAKWYKEFENSFDSLEEA